MALDRQAIEKTDFPIGRRGYDPEAVDAHLRTLADEVDDLKTTTRRRTESLSASASERVRAIVEAAESSAAEIQRQAEEDARDIRSEATQEAQVSREQATTQAREYVSNVSESSGRMLQRVDAMESELSSLVESLRTGGNRLTADLKLLEEHLDHIRDAVAPGRPAFQREEPFPQPDPAQEADLAAAAQPTTGQEAAAEPHLGEETLAGPAAEPVPAAGETVDGEDDAESARLVALNMALNGTPREETDRYLAENFELASRDELLDEVYASVGG